VRRPQSNGFIERFHRTLLNKHLRPSGRTTYESVEEMQSALDLYLRSNNTERTHRGRGMKGRTPEQVFFASLPQPSIPSTEEVPEDA